MLAQVHFVHPTEEVSFSLNRFVAMREEERVCALSVISTTATALGLRTGLRVAAEPEGCIPSPELPTFRDGSLFHQDPFQSLVAAALITSRPDD